jgi:[ribosomal protein S5]-alanine N-acetyltransferase
MSTELGGAFPAHLRMPETPRLETRRLILRPVVESDIDANRRRFPQWDVVKYLSDSVPWPVPDGDFEIAMADTLAKMARRERCTWAVTLKGGDDEQIGRVDLWADDGVSRDQRGFWLDPAFWGQGLMSEAADRVTDFALVELGWPHLWLNNAEANVASHRVKEKQGAQIVERVPRRYVYGEGVRVVWLLTREAWLARRPASPR